MSFLSGSVEDRTAPILLYRPVVLLSTLVAALGVDALSVALIWQHALGAAARLPPTTYERLALGLTVWIVYLLDRQFDARRIDPSAPATARHRLHAQHPVPFRLLLACLLLALLVLLPQLPLALLLTGLIIASATAAHLVAAQFLPRLLSGGLKETLVGTLFALGCAAHLIARHLQLTPPHVQGVYEPGVAVSAALLAALFTLNCLLISSWEHRLDHAQHLPSLSPARLEPTLRILIPALVTLALLWFAGGLLVHRPGRAALGLAIALSATALHHLHSRPRHSPIQRHSPLQRLAADAVLLAPLLTLPMCS